VHPNRIEAAVELGSAGWPLFVRNHATVWEKSLDKAVVYVSVPMSGKSRHLTWISGDISVAVRYRPAAV